MRSSMRHSVSSLLLLFFFASSHAYHASPSPAGEKEEDVPLPLPPSPWSDLWSGSLPTTSAPTVATTTTSVDALLGDVELRVDLSDLDSRLARSPILLMREETTAGQGGWEGEWEGEWEGGIDNHLLALRAETLRIRNAVEPMREMLARTVRRAAEAECASDLMLLFVVGCLLSLSFASSRRARDSARASQPSSTSPIVVIAQPADEEEAKK